MPVCANLPFHLYLTPPGQSLLRQADFPIHCVWIGPIELIIIPLVVNMQEKAALAATSSLGILGCWASRTQQHWQQQQQRHWEGVLLARGQGGVQGREVRPVSQNLELWSTPEKLLRMPGNRRNQCRFLGVHAGHARISCSWYVVGYFDHTGARGGYQGHAMGRWPDMADTQTWLPLAVPTLPSKKTICACDLLLSSSKCFAFIKALVH